MRIKLLVLLCLWVSIAKAQSYRHVDVQKEKTEIKELIRNVLIWSDSCRVLDLYPAISDEKGILYTGFDLDKVNENLTLFKQTGFFSGGFIENYNHVSRILDRKIRNKELEWQVGDLQPFNFNMSYIDVNPWCLCQGFSIEQFDDIEIINLKSSSAELRWKWTKDASWVNFKFNVVREDNRWKVSYMEGFDYKEH